MNVNECSQSKRYWNNHRPRSIMNEENTSELKYAWHNDSRVQHYKKCNRIKISRRTVKAHENLPLLPAP